MSKKYKNVSDEELNLIGHGIIKPGEEITSDEEIINPNFQEVGGVESPVAPTPQPQEEIKTEVNEEVNQ